MTFKSERFHFKDNPADPGYYLDFAKPATIVSETTGGVFAKNSDGSYPAVYSGYWRGYGSGDFLGNQSWAGGLTVNVTSTTGFRGSYRGWNTSSLTWAGSSNTFTFTFNKSIAMVGFAYQYKSYYSGYYNVNGRLEYENDKGVWVSIGSFTKSSTSFTTNNVVKSKKWRLVVNGGYNEGYGHFSHMDRPRMLIANSAVVSTNPFPNNENSTSTTISLTSSNTHNYKTDGLIVSNTSKPYIEVDPAQKIRERYFNGTKFSEQIYTVNAGDLKTKTVPSNGSYEYELIT